MKKLIALLMALCLLLSAGAALADVTYPIKTDKPVKLGQTWGIIPQHLPWIATAMSRKRCARKAQTGCRPSFRECRETEEEIHKWVRYG